MRLAKDTWQLDRVVGEAPGGETLRLIQRLAKLCLTCGVSCGESHRHCVDQFATGKAGYNRVLYFLAHSEDLCERMSELCSCRVPPPAHLAESCARSCEECAEECERLEDPALAELARVCRDTAGHCREVAGSFSSHSLAPAGGNLEDAQE